ncbi:MAG: response regulator [Deltaproteobacteria bacterium]|nr:response regulator [Deltaproteobacteria bacterium]
MARKPSKPGRARRVAGAKKKAATPDALRRLRATNARLRERLREAESTITAIHMGHADGLVVHGQDGAQVFTLQGTDQRYRQLVETMNEGALLLDDLGTIVYANARVAELAKVPLGRLMGSQVQVLVPDSSRHMLDALLRSSEHRPQSAELELQAIDGTRVPVYLSASASWDAELRLTYVIVTDLSDQKRSQAIVGAEGLASLIVDQATDGLVVCDPSGRVVRASHAAHRIAGTNILLDRFADVVPLRNAEGAEVAHAIVASALRGEVTSGLEVTLGAAGPSELALLVSAGPVLAPDSTALGCVLSFVDVTERKRIAQERLELLEVAQAANRAKDEFLAMLGHELRNPLAPILTSLELMRLESEVTMRREREIIERQVHHMVRLIADLFDVSRITQGKVKLDRAAIEVAHLVARAVELATPLIEERRHHLSVQVTPGLILDADETRMCQVLTNLLTNAAKFTEPGGQIDLVVTQEAKDTGGHIVMTVKDSGVGIPAALLPHVFDSFVQGQRTSARSEGGLGLGLAIVRSMVELHGGTVSARSAGAGQGSEFEIRVPPGRRRKLRPSEAPNSLTRTPSAPRRVLIVDDNQDAAGVLGEALVKGGHVVRVAYDGPTALDVARTFHPQVALLDIGLPVMDGYEVARQLRTLELGGDRMRIIAVTGYGQDGDRVKTADAGFDAHLVKPATYLTVVGLLTPPSPPDEKEAVKTSG